MEKIKYFFTTPLISSSTKVIPWKLDPSTEQKSAKPKEVPRKKSPQENAKALQLRKSRTESQSHRGIAKKYSLPSALDIRPETIPFDFEPFEEVVDKRILALKKGDLNNEDDNTPSSPIKRARGSSFAGHENSLIKKNKENNDFPKKSKFAIPHNIQTIDVDVATPIGIDAAIFSPLIRSPLNQSRDEMAGLLNDGGNSLSLRKDKPISALDLFEEFKKKENKGHEFLEPPDRDGLLSSQLTCENLETKTQVESKEYERNDQKHEKEENCEQNDEELKGEPLLRKSLFIEKNEKDCVSQNEIVNNSNENSRLDSLVEADPFEDFCSSTTRSDTLSKTKSRLRDDFRYSHLKWMFLPDDPLRRKWDFIIAGAMFYTALVMPIRVAFMTDNEDNVGWVIMDWLCDGIFFLDIFITFFSAYFNDDDELIVSRKKIIWHYITGWFILDVVSIIPFSLITKMDASKQRLNTLIRVTRLPRLYRLVKIVKLVRMLKVIKDRDRFKNYMNDVLKLTPAYERLFISVGGILLFCHIAACIWYMLVGLGDSAEDWLSSNGLEELSKFDIYVACAYFVVQTVITVGYGELAPKTSEERLLACFLMVFGVLFYSLFIGFVSSLINDVERMNQRFNQKLHTLYRLKNEYSLPVFFTKKLLTAIKFQNKQTITSKDFIKDLPSQLAIELSCIMHKEITDNITFLQGRPKSFIAALCPLLKPITIPKKEIIFREGDPADEIFFVKSGTVGFVLPNYKNECFLKIRQGYFFGEIDLIFYGEIRRYTAMALRDSELYVLNKKDFKHIFLTEHREIGKALYDNAYKRKNRTRKAFKEATEICKKRQDSPLKDGHQKLRLTLSRNKLEDFDSSSEESVVEGQNPLLGIVEEAEEEEEELQQLEPEERSDRKHGINFTQLKAALAFKRKLGPRMTMVKAFGGPSKEIQKEDGNIEELNKKIDGLESKLAKLADLGQAMKANSMKNVTIGIENKKLSAIIQNSAPKTSINKPHIPVESLGLSPTDSEGADGSAFRSPNTLRRAVVPAKLQKESQNSIFKVFPQMRHFKLSSDSSPLNGENNNATFQTPNHKIELKPFKIDYIENTVETEMNLLTEGTLADKTQRDDLLTKEEKGSNDSEEKRF